VIVITLAILRQDKNQPCIFMKLCQVGDCSGRCGTKPSSALWLHQTFPALDPQDLPSIIGDGGRLTKEESVVS
jgi:hypothetical protein